MKKTLLFITLFFIAFIVNAQTPTTPSSTLKNVIRDGNRMNFSFTKGNGAKRLIIAKVGTAVTNVPTDGVDYIAGGFGLGNEIVAGSNE